MAQWTEITGLDEWNRVLEKSNQHPVLVMKHSTRCPISADAWEEFQQFVAAHEPDAAEFMMVKVIESREVSDRIAEELDVQHQSPQVILVRDGRAVWNTSHWHIKKPALEEAMQAV